nr:uncharacterized protein LOC129384779 [Dermacentor andersoni]
MSKLTSVDLRGVPRGRCKNTEYDCPELSRYTTPLTTNYNTAAGWCSYCRHSPAWNSGLAFESELRFSNTAEDNVIRPRKILPTVATLPSLAEPPYTGVYTFLRPMLVKSALILAVPRTDIFGLCIVWGDVKQLVCGKEPEKS